MFCLLYMKLCQGNVLEKVRGSKKKDKTKEEKKRCGCPTCDKFGSACFGVFWEQLQDNDSMVYQERPKTTINKSFNFVTNSPVWLPFIIFRYSLPMQSWFRRWRLAIARTLLPGDLGIHRYVGQRYVGHTIPLLDFYCRSGSLEGPTQQILKFLCVVSAKTSHLLAVCVCVSVK